MSSRSDLLELLETCARQGIELGVVGEDLRVSAPAGVVTSELRERLRFHKAELIGNLRRKQAVPTPAIGPAPAGADAFGSGASLRRLGGQPSHPQGGAGRSGPGVDDP